VDRVVVVPLAAGDVVGDWIRRRLISIALLIGKPIDVLKGTLRLGVKSGSLRSGMVVFQFASSIMLIIGTFVIYKQVNFMMNRDVGFDKEQVMIVDGTNTLGDKKEVFRTELLKLSAVERVSLSGFLPVAGMNREGYGFWNEGKEKQDKPVSAQKWRVDADYISTMKMKLLEGRDFIRGMASDSASIIINQTMAGQLGLKNPIGARITNGVVYTVIGVMADFNFVDMKQPIRPLALVIERWGDGAAAVRLKSTDLPAAIESITGLWAKLMPNQPIRYSFLDERFARMYDNVRRTGQIFMAFAILAVAVACLGLFALSAFITEQRSKEISIRRVMGASVQNIFRMLTGNFMKLVAISWIVATPIAWYGMNQWLQMYTYREPIASSVLIISGAIAGIIALLTVSYQTLKAAFANPVENLRQN
jgi:putative ABC transport system permease protein